MMFVARSKLLLRKSKQESSGVKMYRGVSLEKFRVHATSPAVSFREGTCQWVRVIPWHRAHKREAAMPVGKFIASGSLVRCHRSR